MMKAGIHFSHTSTTEGASYMGTRTRGWLRRAAVAVAVTVLMPLGVSLSAAPSAHAAFDPRGFDFWVNDANGVALKSRVFRAADGNTSRVVYALDGLRARNDLNGWEIDTNVADALTKWNINVVMPVGGENSFYSDWIAPSGFAPGSGSASGSAQRFPYRWESFITNQLPAALQARLGFSRNRNGVFGLSMGGSAALMFAAYYPQQFSYAGSFSGFLNVSAPGMKELMRAAFLTQNFYNLDAMWGPPWDPRWLRNDPFVFAPRLRDQGTRLYIASGTGIPGIHDQPRDLVGLYNTGNGMAIEAAALANTRAFQVRLSTLGYRNVTYDFPPFGTHSWPWWADNVYRMIPDLSRNIG